MYHNATYDENKGWFVVSKRIALRIQEYLEEDPENVVLVSEVGRSKMVFTTFEEMRFSNKKGVAYSVEDLGIPDKNGVYVYDDFEKVTRKTNLKKHHHRLFCVSASVKVRHINISLFKWFIRYSFHPCALFDWVVSLDKQPYHLRFFTK